MGGGGVWRGVGDGCPPGGTEDPCTIVAIVHRCGLWVVGGVGWCGGDLAPTCLVTFHRLPCPLSNTSIAVMLRTGVRFGTSRCKVPGLVNTHIPRQCTSDKWLRRHPVCVTFATGNAPMPNATQPAHSRHWLLGRPWGACECYLAHVVVRDRDHRGLCLNVI